MYFQHHSGQLRQAQLDSKGNWQGGGLTDIVAADAKNGTPIAAVAYARNDTASVSGLRCYEGQLKLTDTTVAYILHQRQQHDQRSRQ